MHVDHVLESQTVEIKLFAELANCADVTQSVHVDPDDGKTLAGIDDGVMCDLISLQNFVWPERKQSKL